VSLHRLSEYIGRQSSADNVHVIGNTHLIIPWTRGIVEKGSSDPEPSLTLHLTYSQHECTYVSHSLCPASAVRHLSATSPWYSLPGPAAFKCSGSRQKWTDSAYIHVPDVCMMRFNVPNGCLIMIG
jgi:hypothetical protein